MDFLRAFRFKFPLYCVYYWNVLGIMVPAAISIECKVDCSNTHTHTTKWKTNHPNRKSLSSNDIFVSFFNILVYIVRILVDLNYKESKVFMHCFFLFCVLSICRLNAWIWCFFVCLFCSSNVYYFSLWLMATTNTHTQEKRNTTHYYNMLCRMFLKKKN